MKYLNQLLFSLLFAVCCSTSASDTSYNMRLLVAKPELFLPVIHAPLDKREAQITPEEYPLAQQLRPLLEQQKYQAVLTLLTVHTAEASTVSSALYLLIAQIQMQLNQPKQAEKNYLSALQLMPDLVRAHQGLSVLYISLEQPKKAQKSLIKAISLGANNSQLYAQLAYLNMQLNSPLSAINAYQQALMLDPDNGNIKNGLLFALTRSKQYAAASSLLDQMLIENSTNADMWIQRANLALEVKDNEKALSSIEVAIRLGTNKPEIYQLAAQIHLSQKNYNRANSLLSNLIDNHQLSMDSFDKLLTWLLKEKQWQHAEKLLINMTTYINDKNRTKNSNDEKSRLWHFQGVLAQSNNNNKKAEKAFNSAINLDPANGESLISLAKLLFKTNQLARAELLYQRAERLSEVKLAAMLGRAQIYIEQQQYDQALTLLRQTRKVFPQRHDLDANIQTLASIVNNQLKVN